MFYHSFVFRIHYLCRQSIKLAYLPLFLSQPHQAAFFMGAALKERPRSNQPLKPIKQQMRSKMKLVAIVIMLCALPLVGCQTNAKFSCHGWTKPPAINDPVQLIQTEPLLSKWILSTDRFGQKQRCWK